MSSAADGASCSNVATMGVVWISTPNEYHARHAVLAAKHGKHVVCEKPMATSIDECNEIVAAVEASPMLPSTKANLSEGTNAEFVMFLELATTL